MWPARPQKERLQNSSRCTQYEGKRLTVRQTPAEQIRASTGTVRRRRPVAQQVGRRQTKRVREQQSRLQAWMLDACHAQPRGSVVEDLPDRGRG